MTCASLTGFFSVMMRQTNIVWVLMVFCCTVIDKLVSQTMPFIQGSEKRSTVSYNFRVNWFWNENILIEIPVFNIIALLFQDMFSVLAFYCKRVYLVPKQVRILFVYLIGYISVLIAFMVFVIVNGSIVVGDKASHEAAVHFPQVWKLLTFTDT